VCHPPPMSLQTSGLGDWELLVTRERFRLDLLGSGSRETMSRTHVHCTTLASGPRALKLPTRLPTVSSHAQFASGVRSVSEFECLSLQKPLMEADVLCASTVDADADGA
jgi:hypothetical protein